LAHFLAKSARNDYSIRMEREEEQNGTHDESWLAVSIGLVDGNAAARLSPQRIDLWVLVLDARSIPCRVEADATGRQLLVPAAYFNAALNELRLFEEENRNWPPPVPPARPLAENSLATLSILLLLATFHNITQLDTSLPGTAAPDWIALGNAQAAAIRDGQWWRLVTALTLHSDVVHLISNLSIGGIFVYFLCSELGSGLAWSLLLASGILGNLANAYVQSPAHSSIGASTTVFGAVGILASISLVRYRQQLRHRWPLPVAAALALLALLGTEGKNTDLGAHLFGFCFGIVLGLLTEYLLGTHGRPGRGVNALLALLSAVVVLTAWWEALTLGAGGPILP
jgi:rhomboid protease GluP